MNLYQDMIAGSKYIGSYFFVHLMCWKWGAIKLEATIVETQRIKSQASYIYQDSR